MKMAGNGSNGNFFNGCNCQKGLKMYELLEMTGINLKQLEITENGQNGLIGQKCLASMTWLKIQECAQNGCKYL